jgi:hypothetical protein
MKRERAAVTCVVTDATDKSKTDIRSECPFFSGHREEILATANPWGRRPGRRFLLEFKGDFETTH